MKYKLLILLMVLGYVAEAQPTNIPGYTTINSRYNWLGGVLRALTAPGGSTHSLQTGQYRGAGALAVDTVGADSGFYYMGPGEHWHRLAKYTDLVGVGIRFGVSGEDDEFTANRAVDMDGYQLIFNSNSGEYYFNLEPATKRLEFYSQSVDGLKTSAMDFTPDDAFIQTTDTTHLYLLGVGAGGNEDGTGVIMLSSSAYGNSLINVKGDSITIKPQLGKINIDSLRTASDTTTYKPLAWSPTTKALVKHDYWPGGGSPGGADTDVQINDVGSFYGESAFTYNKTTNTLDVDGVIKGNNFKQYAAAGTADFLQVNANNLASSSDINPGIDVFNDGSNLYGIALIQVGGAYGLGSFFPSHAKFSVSTHVSGSYPDAQSDFTERFAVNGNGEVWIGMTDVGSYLLQVGGTSYFSSETQHEVQLKVKDISPPSTPASGYGLYYVNSDLPAFKGDGGDVFNFLGTDETQTISNKRITKRTGTTASSATPTINTDNVDFYSITALSVAITSFTTNLSGTPTEGQTLWITITDDGTPRTIAWGASFEASATALPTTTVASTRGDYGFVWNTVTSKWRIVASQ